MKHTPGPWKCNEMKIQDGSLFVEICSKDGWIADVGAPEEMNYNARLIAAAPDLLAACKLACEMYDALAMGPLDMAVKYGPDHDEPTHEERLSMRGDLEEAIAKAEGKTNESADTKK